MTYRPTRPLALLLSLLVAVGAALAPTSAAQAGEQEPAGPSLRAGFSSASGSVLGYQCGEGVCLVDPVTPRSAPTQVVADGRFAGVTVDGRTVSYVDANGDLVLAPTTGGAGTVVYTESVGFQPSISPDGQYALWQYAVPVNGYYYTMRLTIATGEVEGVSACLCIVSHGWLGTTPVGAFSSDTTSASEVCALDTTSQSSCARTVVSDPRGQMSFPDGSADGQFIVASYDPAGSEFGGATGPIALYSTASGAVVRDLTTGATDATPTFSPDATAIAFDRADQIVVHDIATGQERVVADGVYPSWGGSPQADPTAGATGKAKPAGKVAQVRGAKVAVPVRCTTKTRCTGAATLVKGRKVLATSTYAVPGRALRTVKLRLTKAGKKATRGNGRLKATLSLGGRTSKVTVRH